MEIVVVSFTNLPLPLNLLNCLLATTVWAFNSQNMDSFVGVDVWASWHK